MIGPSGSPCTAWRTIRSDWYISSSRTRYRSYVSRACPPDVELHFVVRSVRLVLADVADDARSPQGRPAEPDGDGVCRGDDADVLRAPHEDAVARQQVLVVGYLLLLLVAEGSTFLSQPGGTSAGWPPIRIVL